MRFPVMVVGFAGLIAPLAAQAGPTPYFTAPAHGHAVSSVPQIQHVIIIMQENRSFDSYFGTFPGVNGLPPDTCVPLTPKTPQQGCVAPFHNLLDASSGANHYAVNAIQDLDDGVTKALMDGFVYTQSHPTNTDQGTICYASYVGNPWCWVVHTGPLIHDVMGYHTDQEIPNYWAYAEHFRLHDAMFPGIRSYSLPSHLQLTSQWSASCTDNTNAATCTTNLAPSLPTKQYPWVSLFQLFDVNAISWKFYNGAGTEPDCDADENTCFPAQLTGTGSSYTDEVNYFWSPAPMFTYVKHQGKKYITKHVVTTDQFLLDIAHGTLPQVSWMVPQQDFSEHPPFGVTTGMNYVTSIINTVMQSPTYWGNTVIFLGWDDWGGFYDHVVPPVTLSAPGGPAYGFGLRVPAITIGAYVIPGVDHATYSFDSYARFIEDLFITKPGAINRLDPTALGNPDSRPYIADALTSVKSLDGTTVPLGDLMKAFDFTQAPLPPLVLSNNIPGGLLAVCTTGWAANCTSTTVQLSWQGLGANVTGVVYHITRDGVEVPGCATTAIACTDTPGSGTHLYRAYAVVNGAASPLSAAAQITEP